MQHSQDMVDQDSNPGGMTPKIHNLNLCATPSS